MKRILIIPLVALSMFGLDILPTNPHSEGRRVETHASAQTINVEFTPKQTLKPVPVGFDRLMLNAGATEAELDSLRYIIGQESGFCAFKWENQRTCPDEWPGEIYSVSDSTKGFGLCQATPAIKYAEQGADWRTNPVTQAKWCIKYMRSYGSAADAVSFKHCLGSCYSKRTKNTVYKVTPWF